MWIVRLTKKPVVDVFRNSYFPRLIYYKKDAVKLVEEVRRCGGDASVEKAKKGI